MRRHWRQGGVAGLPSQSPSMRVSSSITSSSSSPWVLEGRGVGGADGAARLGRLEDVSRFSMNWVRKLMMCINFQGLCEEAPEPLLWLSFSFFLSLTKVSLRERHLSLHLFSDLKMTHEEDILLKHAHGCDLVV